MFCGDSFLLYTFFLSFRANAQNPSLIRILQTEIIRVKGRFIQFIDAGTYTLQASKSCANISEHYTLFQECHCKRLENRILNFNSFCKQCLYESVFCLVIYISGGGRGKKFLYRAKGLTPKSQENMTFLRILNPLLPLRIILCTGLFVTFRMRSFGKCNVAEEVKYSLLFHCQRHEL